MELQNYNNLATGDITFVYDRGLMRFSTRNAYYLRASNYRVVPLFLYLDERHVDWMSENVLELVIADLKTKIEDLLITGRFSKKHKVHVERRDGYQYCYFLRTTTRTEVVLVKKKTYSLRPPSPPPTQELDLPPSPSRKRKANAIPRRNRYSRSRSRSASLVMAINDDDTIVKAEPIDTTSGNSIDFTESEEAREISIKDWKPDVSLAYQGFGTSSTQLVLIIEPYPPLPPSEYAPPSSRLSSRSTSLAASRSRSRTQGTARYSSASLSLDAPPPQSTLHSPNLRNATRSVSLATSPGPSSRRGGTIDPRESSTTPGLSGGGSGRKRAVRTPLFIPRDTPFGDDEEDEDEHEAYEMALREGRMRLPSVLRRGGHDDNNDEDLDDIPEGMMAIGQRLIRSSEIEEGVIRSQGGWEERGAGEESAVLGREEPGD